MVDYKEMYFKLAGLLANTIEELDELSDLLKTVQREVEESFVEENNMNINEQIL